jgi:hypothetical protein
MYVLCICQGMEGVVISVCMCDGCGVPAVCFLFLVHVFRVYLTAALAGFRTKEGALLLFVI